MIEQRIASLKETFIHVILRNRPWESRENIEQLFEASRGVEVTNMLKKLEQKHSLSNLQDSFSTKLFITHPDAKAK
jgi:hypothetical protein